ncbi:MAG: hypothetical protein ISR88_05985 [Candidatus Marinimicrobia bacterium]|nr:hypothetical protein [Candidatus Neomarinimicrobiota bacterium]
MKYSKLILIIFLVLVCSVVALGQDSQAKVRIEATVFEYLEMITLADIDVGTIIPSEGTLRLNPRTDAGAGIIKLQGRPNTAVQVSFSGQIEMVNIASNTTLSVTYRVSGNSDNDQAASDIFTTNPAYIELNNIGEYYLWIGCEFSMDNLVSGQYDGDFVLDVDYN